MPKFYLPEHIPCLCNIKVSRRFSVVNLLNSVLRWACYLCTVGQVVHTLSEGEPVVGVTSLAGEVYVLRDKERDQVEVYDAISYCLQRRLTVPNRRGCIEITSCSHNRCVYVANDDDCCVHGLGVEGTGTTWWCVNDKPSGLWVNAAHNLLVTCRHVRKIKEFSTHGKLLRELTLPDHRVINLWHAIQLTSGQFIACNGNADDAVHGVRKISDDGRQVLQSHGGQPGSATAQYNWPVRLAVDDNEFVFVTDLLNRRVTLLSPTLGYIRQVVASDDLKWYPRRLCLDIQRRRLYVADNEWKNGTYTAGRVVVFSV